MKKAFIVLALLIIQQMVIAQQKANSVKISLVKNISGKVKDNAGKPIEFATVTLLSAKDSSLVKGALTDTLGIFEIPTTTFGNFILSVTSIGYERYFSKQITLTEESPSVDLGEILVLAGSQQLAAIVIQGEKQAIERQIGKILVNPSNGIFKTSSNALDILSRSPGIIIDANGGISLKGTSPLIMIDGKNQTISVEELRALPPDAIEQIEIISNAGAKFDGETRSVINIKLKRDKNLGLKGDSFASFSQNKRYASYGTGFSLSFKTKKWVFFGRYGYNNDNDYLDRTTSRNVNDAPILTNFNEANSIKFASAGHSIRAGADYSLTKQQTIGVLVKGNFTTGEQNSYNLTQITTSQNATQTNLQRLETTNLSGSTGTNLALNLNYRGTISKKGATLTGDFDIANYDIERNQNFTNQYLNDASQVIGIPSKLRNNSPSTTKFQSLKMDFSQPINATTKLEIGVKTSWSSSQNNLQFDTLAANQWVSDALRSNQFLYKEQIIGAYSNLSKEIGKLSMEFGLRVENTATQGNSLTLGNVVDRTYFRWLPSAVFMYKFNDNNSLTLGYARKLTRPSYYDLNPFKYYLNPFSYTEGNPFLLPITRDAAEISYNYKDYSLGVSYRKDADVFAQMPVQDDKTQILYYTRVNLNTQKVLSFDLYAPVKIFDWWQMQHNLSVYYLQVKSAYLTSNFNNSGWAYYFDGSQAFTLSKTLSAELNYYYSSPSVSQIYHNASSGEVGINLKQSLWNKKADLILNFTDIFNTYQEKFTGQYLNIDIATRQLRGTQAIKLRLNYRFGSSTFNRRNRNTGSTEEENRVKMN